MDGTDSAPGGTGGLTSAPSTSEGVHFVRFEDDDVGESEREHLPAKAMYQSDDFADFPGAHEDYGKTDSVASDEGYSYRPARNRLSTDELTAYDLNPPPPAVSEANAAYIASRLFSADHLEVILKDTQQCRRFRSFLEKYHPQSAATLVHYLETQKALAAIRYANSLAGVVSATRSPHSQESSHPSVKSEAAVVDTHFEGFAQRAVAELVDDALPAYITHQMITVVTECLVKDITATSTPFMRELVQGLAEVFCLSDPNQPDSPLVFASEGTTLLIRDHTVD